MIAPSHDAPATSLRSSLDEIANYAFFHLVKELREAGIQGPLPEMSVAIQSILAVANFGAIGEVRRTFLADEPWAADWARDHWCQSLITIFGEANVSTAIAEDAKLSSDPNYNSQYLLCGTYAARNLVYEISIGQRDYDYWLEHYEGMFASTARLYNVI